MFSRWKKIIRRKVVPKRVNHSYQLHKEAARVLLHARLEYFNLYYQLSYNRVSIRDQKRCWGSCSSKGNLNFSYKLLFLPPCLRDYVVVHELSHLKVLNHSIDFWNTVGKVMPDYAARAASLRVLERTVGTGIRNLQRLAHSSTCAFCAVENVSQEINLHSNQNVKETLHSRVITEVTNIT